MMYEYWLASVKGIPDRKKIRLRKLFGCAEHIYYIEETSIKDVDFLEEKEKNALLTAKKRKNIKESFEELEKKFIHFVPFYLEDYPEELRNLSSPPYALYVKGNLPEKGKTNVAVVGARNCTAYGEKYALLYGQYLAENDVQIISGMARGVDGFGHRGALNGNGKTFAVLGCGVDICYPRENIGLYHDILAHGGGILSEFLPGTQPVPQNFPMRNRIISGLSRAVLVMEARKRSGSLITADMALEQGKDVYALPGSLESPLSEGCNHLISQGAGILLSPESLLENLGFSQIKACKKVVKNEKMLESDEKVLYSRVNLYPKDINCLIEETGFSASNIMKMLVSLELKGFIKEISKNHYIRL